MPLGKGWSPQSGRTDVDTLYFSLAVGFQVGSRLLGVVKISVPSGAAKFKLPPSAIVSSEQLRV